MVHTRHWPRCDQLVARGDISVLRNRKKGTGHIGVIFIVAETEMEFDNFTVSTFATLGNHTRKNITSDDIYFHKVR